MTTIAQATQELADAGVPSARHDAEALAAYFLGVRRQALPMGDLGADYDALVRRRALREPLQYIVGSAGFRHIDVLVGPGVFVPRPETELVAGWVIDVLRGHERPTVVDLCSGPGTIALAIADEIPSARVHAVEVDPVAATWARKNVDHLGSTVVVHEVDVADALSELDGTVDAVVANPPYIPPSDAHLLDREVREFEPVRALFADDDGLAVIRDVVATASRLLRPGGVLAVEHGEGQGSAVFELIRPNGFVDVADHRDLLDRDRFATARRR